MNYNYTYTYDYGTLPDGAATGILAAMGAYMIFVWAIIIFMLVCMWRIFTKAGKEGWKCLIPIYNFIVLLEIVELPAWYIALFFVPFANIYALFKIYIELAHKFGKSTGFGVLTVFFSVICMPILAFSSSAVYQGNNYNNQPNNQGPNPNYSNMNNQMPNDNAFANSGYNSINQQSQPINQVEQAPTNFESQANIPTNDVQQPQQTPVTNTKFCTNCGAQVDINATFCPNCGNQFNNQSF